MFNSLRCDEAYISFDGVHARYDDLTQKRFVIGACRTSIECT